MEYISYSRKKIICMNCGKNGHEFKVCTEPTTSFGVINIKILSDDNENLLFKEKFSNKKTGNQVVTSKKYPNIKYCISSNINLDNDNYDSYKMNNLFVPYDTDEEFNKFCYYRNKIAFLMVSRKFSLGFIEFIRGKYDVSDTKAIINLFEQMTPDEIKYIHKNNYDDILYYFLNRNNEPKEMVLNRIYEGKYSMEYCESKMKFDMLRNPQNNLDDDIAWGLHFYTRNIKPKWKKSEWGFPKGRRDNKNEDNLICACREFEEETGYNKNDYLVLGKIEPIEERLTGTNNINYKHIYYLSIDLTDCCSLDSLKNDYSERELEFDRCEIGDVSWFTYDEAVSHIRPYHLEKKKILTRVYLFIINYLVKCNHL